MKKNNPTYRLYPKAVQDLEDIYHYSVKIFGYKKAESYIRDMENIFNLLTKNHKIAREANAIKSGLKVFQSRSHMIFFEKVKDGIDIIRILHKSRDFSRHI